MTGSIFSIRQIRVWIILVISLVISSHLWARSAQASQPVDAGYRDFSFGTTVDSTPTGEKPESKLWWNDGSWWGSLWNKSAGTYRIYRLNLATQDWIDTGTLIDDRPGSRADALWDGQHLYIVSHIFIENGGAPVADQAQRGRLYRYSYNSGANPPYTLDNGFPVNVTGGKSETLVVDKDSTGRLWVVYTESRNVMINHSLYGNDASWGTPFVLPVTDTSASGLDSDDIASLIAYDGRIGVMWSNQNTHKMYFAAHVDGAANGTWQSVSAYAPGNSGADDHINLKSLHTDGLGRVFAVTKTSFSGNQPLINLLACSNGNGCTSANSWQAHTIYKASDNHTRPILLIDTGNRNLHVFSTAPTSGGVIYHKVTSMDNIQFSSGHGAAFIKSSLDGDINNATSTKQNLNSSTGLVVLASDDVTHFYLHGYMNLSVAGAPAITSFNPASGLTGTSVTLTGSNFTGATGVAFNGTPATFTVNSNAQIQTSVPAGATSGPISVTNSVGTGMSSSNFTVTTPQFTLTTKTVGSGSIALNPPTGTYASGSVVTITATPAVAYQFTGWSGAVTGSTNPITVTMTSNKSVTATFTQLPPPLTLTISTVGSGNVTLTPPGGVYAAGTTVTMTATPASGYQFSGWSGNIVGLTNPVTVTMTSNKSVTATFAVFSPATFKVYLPLIENAFLK